MIVAATSSRICFLMALFFVSPLKLSTFQSIILITFLFFIFLNSSFVLKATNTKICCQPINNVSAEINASFGFAMSQKITENNKIKIK